MKAAILVLADVESHGDLGRVVNAMIAAQEFKEAGDDVQLIFDGAGTQWPGVLSEGTHKSHQLYASVADRIPAPAATAPGHSARRTACTGRRCTCWTLIRGHPSIRSLLADGYQVLTF